MSGSILAAIVASTRRSVEVRAARTPFAALPAGPARPARPAGAFRRALEGGRASGPRVIAECKRRSPSKGVLRRDYDPAAIARGYEWGGASAISVLTEPAFFDGALEHLAAVRAAVSIPVLRKDFIVTPYQIAEARSAGADAVLLIVAALDDASLGALLECAADEGVDALVEVHDAGELARAVAAGAGIIGVNSRDLNTLAVDPSAFEALVRGLPAGVVRIAESGIRDSATIARLGAAGYDACLIGERFMSEPVPGDALRAMRGAS